MATEDGRREEPLILARVDGRATANVEHKLVRHSPTGFEWGYGGSGPSDLALNVLLAYGCDEEEAWRFHHAFKDTFIATAPPEGGTLPAEPIHWWIDMMRETGGDEVLVAAAMLTKMKAKPRTVE